VQSGCENPRVAAPFFCEHVRNVLERTAVGSALGATLQERQDRLLAGGLTIRTTLDPAVQRAVQAAADEQVPREDPFQAATAINSVEPGTGKIKAMAVNRYYSEQDLPGHSKVNLATGGSSGMQAGSTFKPFILTAALQQGIPLGLDIYSPNRYISDVFEGYDDEGNLVPYSLSNAGDSETGGGTYDLRTGTWQSVNTFYVQLQERTGIEQPAALAEAMGLKWFKGGSPSEPLQRVPSFVLGVNEISPLSLAAAYATFPAHGRFCPPKAVVEILTRPTSRSP
jgi:membrane peptidoglycan carboxypeptidase